MIHASPSVRVHTVIAGLVLVAASAGARAAVINVSTGLDASDNLITVGNAPDAHWTVDQPLGGTAPARIITAADPGFPGAWAPNGPGSSWITIDANSVGNAPVVPYTYYRNFTLSAADLATAALIGTWGIDDGGELRLNGNLISTLPNDYSATTPFFVPNSSGFFLLGANVLTITMTSSDNFFEAVRLEGIIPAPGAAMLGLVGAGVMGLRRRR